MDMGVIKSVEVNRITPAAVPAKGAGDPLLSGKSDLEDGIGSGLMVTQVADPVAAEPAKDEQLQSAIADMQSFVQTVNRDLDFQVDDASGKVVVNVTDRSSGEVIRQIPSKEALRIAENLAEVRSLLFKAEA